MLYENDDEEASVPVGWEEVTLGDDFDAFCEAAERGDLDEVAAIVERAYQRSYARRGGEILERNGV